MTSRQKLINELHLLNQKLENINGQSRFMVYNANPLRFAFYNFLAGTLHSLGNLFGTVVVTAAVIYLFTRLNLAQSFTLWFQGLLESTINQIIPQLQPQNPFGI